MLYIVSTPIGNLEDLSQRALKTLQECDAVLCEDSRRTSVLLQRFGIQKPLVIYHQFKERELLDRLLARLEKGEKLALVSDAGTPCINDPGLILAQACIERGLPFTAIPGSCSVIQALVLSGLETERFQFIGFLPRKGEQRVLKQVLNYPGTTVCFESPERLVDSLKVIEGLDAGRRVAVVREMTKVYEEAVRGRVNEVRERFEKEAPRGEIVVVIGAGKIAEEEMGVEELVGMLQELHGLSLKEAIKMAAKLKGIPKSRVYKEAHSKN